MAVDADLLAAGKVHRQFTEGAVDIAPGQQGQTDASVILTKGDITAKAFGKGLEVAVVGSMTLTGSFGSAESIDQKTQTQQHQQQREDGIFPQHRRQKLQLAGQSVSAQQDAVQMKKTESGIQFR